MSETTARRRAAWQALKLGPLWQPVATALPGAHWPDDRPAEAGQATGDAHAAWPASPGLPQSAGDAGMAAAPPSDLPPAEAPIADTSTDPGVREDTGKDTGETTDGPPGHAPSAPPPEADGSQPEAVTTLHTTPDGNTGLADSASALDEAAQPISVVQRWQDLRDAVAGCQRCPLASTRQNTVFGRGRPEHARWLLIGEAPGAEEDRQGEAFVGQAGKLLDAMLRAVGIDPEADVFIANVLKCRPPGNRNPEPAEVAECEGFLHEQIRLTNPDCILLLGRFAAQSVLNTDLAISRLRNKLHQITLEGRQIPVVVTFHPAYLLRNPADKLKSWEDLCLAQTALEQERAGHAP